MSDLSYEMKNLSAKFKKCQKAFVAIGDETRQSIIITLFEGGCRGLRVGQITEKTHLSRPAVSHHLKILKDSNIINMYREGTKNYYYLDPNETEWSKMLDLILEINELIKAVPKDEEGGCCDLPLD